MNNFAPTSTSTRKSEASPGRFDIIASESESQKRQRQFAAKHGLKKSDMHACVNRLIGKRCMGDCPRIPGGDHLSMWTKDGKPFCIVSQPYGLTYYDLKDTLKFCARHGLRIEIDAWPSWHAPGEVLTVRFFRNPVVTLDELPLRCDHTLAIDMLNRAMDLHAEVGSLLERVARELFNGGAR